MRAMPMLCNPIFFMDCLQFQYTQIFIWACRPIPTKATMNKNKNKPLLAMAMMMSAAYLSAEATEVGRPAPQFTLPTLQHQEQTVSLKDQLGKVVYVDFWASWCSSCSTSFPIIDDLHRRLKDKGFEVIAISLDEKIDKAKNFLQTHPVGFLVLYDGKGEWADNYVVESMPTSYIIDKQGVIRYIHHGFTALDIHEVEKQVLELLAK